MFSLVGVLIYIPAISVGGFTSLQTFCRIYLGFFIQPFLSMWGDAPLYIWFAFLWELVMLSVFSCALWPSLWHLWRNVHLDHWLIFNWIFFILSCASCFYVLDINYLWVFSFARIFFHSEGCLFLSLMVSFAVQILFNIRSHLFTFYFSWFYEVNQKRTCCILCQSVFCSFS